MVLPRKSAGLDVRVSVLAMSRSGKALSAKTCGFSTRNSPSRLAGGSWRICRGSCSLQVRKKTVRTPRRSSASRRSSSNAVLSLTRVVAHSPTTGPCPAPHRASRSCRESISGMSDAFMTSPFCRTPERPGAQSLSGRTATGGTRRHGVFSMVLTPPRMRACRMPGDLARQRRKPAPPPGGAGTGLLRAVHARPDDRQGARPANFPERPSAAAACAPAGGSPPATATANAD